MEQKYSPLVTVIIPVYNAEKYLRQAIESIVEQTYQHLEIVLINDGSVDSSESIIEQFSDSRIIYVKNDENCGLIQTLNKGFSFAKGKYIARMDADDISEPMRIQKQVEFLESNPQVGLVGTSFRIFGDKEELVKYPCENQDIRLAFMNYNPFCHPSVMIRNEVITTYGLQFKKAYLHAEEYKLWTEISLYTECANLSECLLNYRSHATQVSQVHLNQQIENSLLIQQEYLNASGFVVTEDIQQFLKRNYHKVELISTDFFLQIIRGMEELLIQNERNLFFNQAKLKTLLSKLFLNLMLEQGRITEEIYHFYKNSSLSNQLQWTKKQRISIFKKYYLTKLGF